MPRHLLIAGTGRAGTSFLVRYLTELGLETHLSRAQSAVEWDEAAQAGLEDIPGPHAADLPYVVKSPWIYQVIHDVLASGTIQFDAVVIPMRDLTEAACSRSIIEMQSLHRGLAWMGEQERMWEHHGHTPGGIVYSLSPIDQARLLAVGFHQLLDRLVQADVPVVLLSFPRFIHDADYLFAKLAPVLPVTPSLDDARAAHAAIADPAKIRVGDEMQPTPDPPSDGFALDGPGPARLERAALTRLLAELRRNLTAAHENLADMTSRMAVGQSAEARLAVELAEARAALSAETTECVRMAERLDASAQALAVADSARQAALATLCEQQAEISVLRERLATIEASAAWHAGLALMRAPRRAALLRYVLPATGCRRTNDLDT